MKKTQLLVAVGLATLTAAVLVFFLRSKPESKPASSPPLGTQVLNFNQHIAPVVHASCSLCHHTGGSGPFPLLTFEDVKEHGEQISEVVESGFMPPWPPAAGHGEFLGDRRLSPEKIALFRTWMDQGALEGPPEDRPIPPTFKGGWKLGEPDLVLEMPEPYILAADGTDDFRNFVLRAPIQQQKQVRAIEILTNSSRVHHAMIGIDRTTASRQRDLEDPLPGFGGMAMGEAAQPSGHVLAWTPGRERIGTDDLPWTLIPGSDVVLQLHLRPSGRPEPIQVQIGFYFTDFVPDRLPALLWLGSLEVDIPAGEANYLVRDRLELPVDVDVLTVFPHAHYVAKQMKAFATRPNGSRQPLLFITAWDFDWQDQYRYRTPIRLEKGSIVEIEYIYDNSEANVQNPNRPPKRILSGETSVEEMATFYLQVRVLTNRDLPTLFEALGTHVSDRVISGLEARLKLVPQAPATHMILAAALRNRGRNKEALVLLKRAVELGPKIATAQNNLGELLGSMERREEALVHFREAVALAPQAPEMQANLGAALSAKGELDEAVVHLSRAIEIWPDHAQAHYNLGLVFLQQGKLEQAVAENRKAIQSNPDFPEAVNNLGQVLAMSGQVDEGIRALGQVVRSRPGFVKAQRNLSFAVRSNGRLGFDFSATGEGLLTTDVASGSGAEQKGLKVADLIISVDGRPANEAALGLWIAGTLDQLRPELPLQVLRENETFDLRLPVQIRRK